MDTKARLDAVATEAKQLEAKASEHRGRASAITTEMELLERELREAGYPVDEGADAIRAKLASEDAEIAAELTAKEQQNAEARKLLDQIEGTADDI